MFCTRRTYNQVAHHSERKIAFLCPRRILLVMHETQLFTYRFLEWFFPVIVAHRWTSNSPRQCPLTWGTSWGFLGVKLQLADQTICWFVTCTLGAGYTLVDHVTSLQSCDRVQFNSICQTCLITSGCSHQGVNFLDARSEQHANLNNSRWNKI